MTSASDSEKTPISGAAKIFLATLGISALAIAYGAYWIHGETSFRASAAAVRREGAMAAGAAPADPASSAAAAAGKVPAPASDK